MSEQNQNDAPPGTFEVSLRVLGNEFIGFKIVVDDLKTKWVTVSLIAVAALGYAVSKFAPVIIQAFN